MFAMTTSSMKRSPLAGSTPAHAASTPNALPASSPRASPLAAGRRRTRNASNSSRRLGSCNRLVSAPSPTPKPAAPGTASTTWKPSPNPTTSLPPLTRSQPHAATGTPSHHRPAESFSSGSLPRRDLLLDTLASTARSSDAATNVRANQWRQPKGKAAMKRKNDAW